MCCITKKVSKSATQLVYNNPNFIDRKTTDSYSYIFFPDTQGAVWFFFRFFTFRFLPFGADALAIIFMK
jgi:hypothetical protein